MLNEFNKLKLLINTINYIKSNYTFVNYIYIINFINYIINYFKIKS